MTKQMETLNMHFGDVYDAAHGTSSRRLDADVHYCSAVAMP